MGIGIMNYQTMRYTYDRLGNRTSKRDVLAEQAGADLDEIYTYDQQNQLIDLDRVGNHERFHYDTTGNWLAYQQNGTLQIRTHNAANEIVSMDGSDTSLRTDAAGNMTRIPNPKAVPGPTVAQNLNLTYDAWNRLVRVSTPDGSEVMSCSYDGLNRRVRKTTASETREYYYNKNWQCLEEYSYGTLQNSYLWGLRYLNDLICFTPDYTIALTDANFNVVAVANQSGLTERYTYTAFGQRTILTPSYAPRSESVYPALTRTFTSQVLDQETGLMLYRNRYYAPTLGRFIVRDPIGYYGNDTNFYRYVFDTPTNWFDPEGTSTNKQPPRPSPQDSAVWTPENCPTKCEETWWGSNFDKQWIHKKSKELEQAIRKNYNNLRVNILVVTAPTCGKSKYALTCARPKGNNKYIIVCIPEDSKNTCKGLAMLEHEFTHVQQYVDNIVKQDISWYNIKDKDSSEKDAYRRSCEVFAEQRCNCNSNDEREKQINDCINNNISLSTAPSNLSTIHNACNDVFTHHRPSWK